MEYSKIDQNRDSHSGTSDPNSRFFDGSFNMRHTAHVLAVVLTHITKFIKSFSPPLPNIVGIELLNEPAPGHHTAALKQWYSDAIRSLRVIDARVPIVIGDSWQTDDYAGYLSNKADSFQHPHVVLDHHLYRCFTQEDTDVLAYDHAGRLWDLNGGTRQTFARVTDKLQSAGCDMIVGEWSGALNPKSLDPLPNKDHARSQFIQAQVDLYEQYCAGNFFWTYKKQWEGDRGWSFRDAVRGGVFPKSIGLRLKRPLEHHSHEARLNAREVARNRALSTPRSLFTLSTPSR
jgi:aryl-phospho-beta-D-glucosidase BglC (GH1 family)